MTSDARSRILLAGCGYLGRALAATLAPRHDVWGLSRSPEDVPPGVRPIVADLSNPADLTKIPAHLDQVVHGAAPGRHDEAAYRLVYVDGLSCLIDAVSASSPRLDRFVLLGSTAVYGQVGGEAVDERSPTEPAGFAGRILLEAERRLARAPFRTTVLRLGGIYGPGRDRLVEEARAGLIGDPTPGDRPRWAHRIHRDDAAAAIAHVLALPEFEPTYLLVDRDPAPRAVVRAWIADRLAIGRRVDDEEPPTRRAGTSKRCSSDRLVASGFRFAFPTWREGYGALLGGDPCARGPTGVFRRPDG